ncbi:MAG: SpaA isopeptide-forming pilin-related protein [Enterococcus sp.]
MKKKREKLVGLFSVVVLIFGLFIQLLPIVTYGESAKLDDSQELFSNDSFTLEGSSNVEEEQITWTLHYEKQAEVASSNLHLGIGLETQSIQVLKAEGFHESEDGSGWIMEDEGEENVQSGELQFATDTSITELAIQFQLVDTSEEEQILAETTEPLLLTAVVNEETSSSTTSTQETTTTEEIEETQKTSESSAKQKEAEGETSESTDASEENDEDVPALAAVLPTIAAVPFDWGARAGSTTNTDPFSYTTDTQGTYPSHNTDEYTASSSSENIRNYNYGDSVKEGESEIKNVFTAGALNFENGYHDYGDAYVKKIVMPTDDPNQFKVQLDMIGKRLETNQQVDIALVLDKSSSMVSNKETVNGQSITRWQAVKNAVKIFSDDLLNDQNNENILLGLASFGSTPSGNSHIPYGEIGSFTANPDDITGNSIYTATPTTNSSGTPTYLGLDAGYAMLTTDGYGARDGAAKVLIVLTDGQPTFAQNSNYTELTNNILDLPKQDINGNDRYNARNGRTDYFTGTGSAGSVGLGTMVDYAKDRSSDYENIKKYSIGYGTNDDTLPVLQAIGQNGYYAASDQQTLINVLEQLTREFTASVNHATMTDPMSEYVTLTSGVTSSALSLFTDRLVVTPEGNADYPSYASDITVTTTENQINLGNITLSMEEGKREGYRIEYTVELKEEYRDGLFYPANKTTVLTNNRTDKPDYLHFAVPSVRSKQTISIPVEKVWTDDANKWKTREDITLQLQSKVGEGEWTDVSGQSVKFAADAANFKKTFSDLPTYQKGQAIQYRIVEKVGDQTFVTGYGTPTYAPASITIADVKDEKSPTLTVTNELVKTGFDFIKVGADGTTPLAGAEFELYLANSDGEKGDLVGTATSGADGKVTFAENYPIGEYILHESQAPEGYQSVEDRKITITQNEDKTLTVAGLPEDGKVVNELYPFMLNLKKTTGDGTALAGAEFSLEGGSLTEPITATSTAEGEVSFSEPLEPGTYTLTETKAPTGFTNTDGPWTVVIGTDKSVVITDKDGKEVYSGTAAFDAEEQVFTISGPTIVNTIKDFELIVNKKDQDGNALTGATFQLEGENYQQTVVGTDSSQFTFTELRPGTYELTETVTPEGFQGLEGTITVVIDENGNVTIDEEEPVNGITENGNVITIDVSNQAKVSLPKTGGMTRLPFILSGLTLLGVFLVYVLSRNLKRKGGE